MVWIVQNFLLPVRLYYRNLYLWKTNKQAKFWNWRLLPLMLRSRWNNWTEFIQIYITLRLFWRSYLSMRCSWFFRISQIQAIHHIYDFYHDAPLNNVSFFCLFWPHSLIKDLIASSPLAFFFKSQFKPCLSSLESSHNTVRLIYYNYQLKTCFLAQGEQKFPELRESQCIWKCCSELQ